jgi:predicted TIM-barrel fold metal-dependent hydrolase
VSTWIIDADTHMNEPFDLFTTRFPAHLLDRAPRVVDVPRGKAWQWDTGRRSSITPLCNAAGKSPLTWTLFSDGYDETFRSGAWDPKARLEDMALDMVDAHVLFPTYLLTGAGHLSHDRDVQIACVQAYNNWISDFAAFELERFIAVALVPVTGVDDAIAEARRAAALPGVRGILLSAWPNGGHKPDHPVDDAFWSAIEELDVALIVHVGFAEGGEVETAGEAADHSRESHGNGAADRIATISLAMLNPERQAVSTVPLLGHLILGGVLDRHPGLRVGFAEVGAGWVPFFLEQTNDNFSRHRFWTKTTLPMMPSEYWFRQCFTTFQQDRYAVRNRDLVGVHTMMWSSDYPHTGADWPNSRTGIANQLQGVSEDEQRLILADNARRLYGLHATRPATIVPRSAASSSPAA